VYIARRLGGAGGQTYLGSISRWGDRQCDEGVLGVLVTFVLAKQVN